MSSRSVRPNETVVTRPGWEVALVWLGFPALGAVLGWLVKPVTTWALSLPWAPFEGPMRVVDSIPEPWAVVVPVALGVILGLVVALSAEDEVLRVGVSADKVSLSRAGTTREFERSSIGAAFADGKALVLLSRRTEELARERSDLAAARLERAFVDHGYPWQASGDPHRDAYRRWVDDTPELSGTANALFKARQKALDGNDQSDADDLRAELAKLGLVIRDDERSRQHWRAVPGWRT